jgi:prolyl-tRNA editing enzyme YbaK/EbsC (Cys-tRNA(Pro) deacylase)
MGRLENASVQRVAAALAQHGIEGRIVELTDTARSAQDAADTIGCELGAIVKSLVLEINGQAVMALIAGDRQCDTNAMPNALSLVGKCKRADADLVRAATGMAIGGVAPVGHSQTVPMVIDGSLARFDKIYAAAGHPYCVFETTLKELNRITAAPVSDKISA